MKVHDVVARTIADHGVRTLFGLMGDANMLYITDFITWHHGRFVPAADERNSVLMAGGYAAAELRTAVNERLPLIVVIANDGAYGAEWRKLKGYGLDPGFSRTSWPDLAELAEACGARGYTVRTVEDLEKLGPVFADLTGPVLVDVRTDPAIEFDLAAG